MSELQPPIQQEPKPQDPIAELQKDMEVLQTLRTAIDQRLRDDPNYDPRNHEGNNDIQVLQDQIEDVNLLNGALLNSADLNSRRQGLTFQRTYINPARQTLENMRQRVAQIEQRNQPQPEKKKDVPEKLETLQRVLRQIGIEPFNTSVDSEQRFLEERSRLSEAISKYVISSINGRLGTTSSNFIPSKTASLWGAISMPSGSPTSEKSSDLEFFINNIPKTISFEINGQVQEREFLRETADYLANLIIMVEAEHSRAVAVQSYKDPQEYISTIASSSFREYGFGREQIRDLVLKDSAKEREEKANTERNVNNSVYEAFRLIKRNFIDMAIFVEPGKKTEDVVQQYKDNFAAYNMYPLSSKQEVDVEAKSDTSAPGDTLAWMMEQLTRAELKERGFTDEVIELAFRWAVASNRSTGLEEYLDVRPHVIEDSSGKKVVESKVVAARTMTRIFHTRAWGKFSIAEKGSARPPYALDLAEKRPAMGLPGEMNWLVTVDLGEDASGKRIREKRNVFEVYRDGLWDKVLDEGEEKADFPGDPYMIYAQHLKYLALPYYEIFGMDEKATKILPDRAKMAKYTALVLALRDRELARIFQKEGREKRISRKDAEYILKRLRSKKEKEMLVRVDEDDLPNYTPSTIFKDAGDYGWDNTILYEPNFQRLFRSPGTGGEHKPIMEAVRRGRKGKEQFVMWSFFTIMVLGELERYRIPKEEQERAEKEWTEDQINLAKPIETHSRQDALHWGEIEAYRRFFLRFQAGLPEKYLEYRFTEDHINKWFRKYGIIETRAADIADVQWILQPEPIRSKMRVRPPFIKGLDKVYDVFGIDEGTT